MRVTHFSYFVKVMAVNESSRLHASLKKESVPVKRLIVNQILPPSATDCKFCAMKRKVMRNVQQFVYITFLVIINVNLQQPSPPLASPPLVPTTGSCCPSGLFLLGFLSRFLKHVG